MVMESKPEFNLITYSFDEIEKSIDYNKIGTFLTNPRDNSKLGRYYDVVNQEFLKTPTEEEKIIKNIMNKHVIGYDNLSTTELNNKLKFIDINLRKRQREQEIKILRDAGYDDEYIFNKKQKEEVQKTVIEKDGKTGEFGDIYYDFEGYKNRKGKADYTKSVY